MSKIQNLAEITPNIPFTEFNFYDLYRSTFEKSELGRIKKLLPLREMAENFGLTSRSLRPRRGRKSYFTPEGKEGPEAKAWKEVIFHAGRQGRTDVPEDVHRTELP